MFDTSAALQAVIMGCCQNTNMFICTGKGSVVCISFFLFPISPSASLRGAIHHGAWRTYVAGLLCSRKETLITPNTTTMQFSSLAKASAPQGCRVRHREHASYGLNEIMRLFVAFWPSFGGCRYRRLPITVILFSVVQNL